MTSPFINFSRYQEQKLVQSFTGTRRCTYDNWRTHRHRMRRAQYCLLDPDRRPQLSSSVRSLLVARHAGRGVKTMGTTESRRTIIFYYVPWVRADLLSHRRHRGNERPGGVIRPSNDRRVQHGERTEDGQSTPFFCVASFTSDAKPRCHRLVVVVVVRRLYYITKNANAGDADSIIQGLCRRGRCRLSNSSL